MKKLKIIKKYVIYNNELFRQEKDKNETLQLIEDNVSIHSHKAHISQKWGIHHSYQKLHVPLLPL